MLLHTQGPDGLLHLYNRLETGGRILLLSLLSAEAGWVILVTAWLQLERAYLKTRLFPESVIRPPVAEATLDWNNSPSFY